jgi:hypothetical protein
MPSGLVQRDLIRDTPEQEIHRYREAARTALVDIHYTAEELRARAAYYNAEADKLERAHGLR